MKALIGQSLGEAALSSCFAGSAAISGVSLSDCKIKMAPGEAHIPRNYLW